MSKSFIEQFIASRRAGVPLLAIQTPDIDATIQTIAANPENAGCPIVLHDCVRGLVPINDPHGKQLVRALAPNKDVAAALCNPIEMLVRALEVPKGTILFMANLHRQMHAPEVVQAIWNLRDEFKANIRTLAILCPNITLPAEIAGDVVVLDEPLPDAKQLEATVLATYEAAKQPKPSEELISKAIDALCGLPSFAAEQVSAMSIRKQGLDLEQLWERKRQQIEQTPGLKVWRGTEKFKDIGGCDNVKTFLSHVINGKERPRAIVFQDELEKQLAGAAGDLSGTTQELLGNQLSFMQDHDSDGVMFIGHAGVAKSAIAKALGNEAGIPTIQLDLGNAKGSLIGESNANMQMILKVIERVSQGRALWIATSNDISALAPELRSRYTFGTFFFDLPTIAERDLIWKIYFEKYNVTDKNRPADTGWTGREIRNCCKLAHRLEISLKEASSYIVPIYTSAAERITGLRKEADGRYISAAKPGPYKKPEGMEEETEQPTVVAVAVVPGQKKRKIDGGSGSVN